MSLVVVHLRWECAATEHYEQLCRLLPVGRRVLDDGIHSRQLRHVGGAVLGTEVWPDDGAAERFLDQLPTVTRAAGLPDPEVVAFVVPGPYAGAWTRAARVPVGDTATPPAIPAQRRRQPDPAPVPMPRPEPRAGTPI
jgi:hypothetical protein